MSEPVIISNVDSVRIISLNRPERKNALDLDDRVALLSALRNADADESCRAIVLTGNDQIFSAGGDISSMSSDDPELARKRLDLVGDVARQLVYSRTPIVSAVEGGAYGLGLSLTCASDLVIAADDAKFCASFGKIGLIADTGLFYSLQERAGKAKARRLLLTAETITAHDALHFGVVDETTSVGAALERATEVATKLAARSVPAVASTRHILSQADQGLEALLQAETEHQVELLMGPDFAEGRAAFFARRNPDFKAT